MNLLGIETSCDETSAAVVADGREVLSSVVSSQIATHAGYGGVVPELAAREHLANIDVVVAAALAEARCPADAIAGVAVTAGPGLIPALLVGMAYAKGFAAAGNLPLVGINHFLAHIHAAFLAPADPPRPERFPILALVVSGGHSALVLLDGHGRACVVGRTLVDAAGEAFDKAAKILNLGYPGGPIIDRLAASGDPAFVHFPRGLARRRGGRPASDRDRFNFSFSGVKTALLYYLRDHPPREQDLPHIAASYQAAIVDVLVDKTARAARHWNARTILLCGGVACNRSLRQAMAVAAARGGCDLIATPPKYCTDNAAMVAGAAWACLRAGQVAGLDLAVHARLVDDADFGPVPFLCPVGA
jgi:N6-L-threonylcarbamoyladenine synthase